MCLWPLIFFIYNYDDTYPYGIVVGSHEFMHVKYSILPGI